MSQTTIERRQLAYDTAANWTAQNPILAMAEIGYETDTGKQKIGNGATAWNSLAYGADASKSPVAGPGSSQAFAVGPLTVTGNITGTGGFASDDSTSNAKRLQLTNVTAIGILGIEGAAGGTIISGIPAYETAIRYASGKGLSIGDGAGSVARFSASGLVSSGRVDPASHNTFDLGTTSVRWRDLWLQSGAFNGSDARLKTDVQPMTAAEIKAASQLSKEIGTYQWLQSVVEKGAENARLHTGLTVQRAIEIMTENGLDWTRYAFIGYDKWDDKIIEHPEILAQEATEESEAVEYQPAWTETVLKAGDAYSFRYDQLNMFIARGFEARLQALEGALS